MVNAIRTQPTCVPTPTVQVPESSGDEAALRPDETAPATRHRSLTCRWTMAQTSSGTPVLTASWVETTAVE